MNKKGFTLIELVVCVAIVFLLATLVGVSFFHARLEACSSGNSAVCEKIKMSSFEATEKLRSIKKVDNAVGIIKEEKEENYLLKNCRIGCAKDEKKSLNDCLTRCDIIYEK